jgi:chorismate dehydratase
VSSTSYQQLRIAAIRFLNPAPLMWDFEHSPFNRELGSRYSIDWMLPSECADRLASGSADLGLVPIASLATTPSLRILPGCTIASKGLVRSLVLVRRADRPLDRIRSVAADTASRTTLVYARILFHKWGNPAVAFLPMAADLDAMLGCADAAIMIGDPALLALEERANRAAQANVELMYHDLAEEWYALSGLPFVSAVWGTSCSKDLDEIIARDLIRSRDHGLQNINAIVDEWSRKLPLSAQTIRSYLTTNIHYTLDEECMAGMRAFFKEAAQCGILPKYEFAMSEAVSDRSS